MSWSADTGEPARRRVGLVGHGAVGSVVAEALRRGAVPGAVLSAVFDRSRPPRDVAAGSLAELIERADIVVEAAGPGVLRDMAEDVLGAGRVLVVLSVGAFADPVMWQLQEQDHAGAMVLCTGALGGLDIIRAASLAGPVSSVHLVTRKRPAALLQPWMPAEQASGLRALSGADAPVRVFGGSAREAARLFPQNLNVAAAAALAAGAWEIVTVELLADASATHTVHELDADTAIGRYFVRARNLPSPDNPATSGIVPYAVLRTLRDLAGSPGTRFA